GAGSGLACQAPPGRALSAPRAACRLPSSTNCWGRGAVRQVCRAVMLGAALSLIVGAGTPAFADDSHHEGYYYPPPTTTETYTARVVTLPDSNRERRIGFVTGMTQQLLGGKYAPSYAVFAKGDEAEKLIIVGLVDGELNSVYRMRALL